MPVEPNKVFDWIRPERTNKMARACTSLLSPIIVFWLLIAVKAKTRIVEEKIMAQKVYQLRMKPN